MFYTLTIQTKQIYTPGVMAEADVRVLLAAFFSHTATPSFRDFEIKDHNPLQVEFRGKLDYDLQNKIEQALAEPEHEGMDQKRALLYVMYNELASHKDAFTTPIQALYDALAEYVSGASTIRVSLRLLPVRGPFEVKGNWLETPSNSTFLHLSGMPDEQRAFLARALNAYTGE